MTTPAQNAAAQRLTLSQIVTTLLARNTTDRSSVGLTRNAKGVTQIEVTVRTGDSDAVETAADAERIASDIYNRLRAAYPLPNGYVGAEGTPDV